MIRSGLHDTMPRAYQELRAMWLGGTAGDPRKAAYAVAIGKSARSYREMEL